MTPEESQKEFEAWINPKGVYDITERLTDGEYCQFATQLAWEAWQKAREK